MLRNRFVVIGVASLAAFVMSSLYYSPLLVGNFWHAVDPAAAAASAPSPWMILAEVLRTIVITSVVAHLLSVCGARGWKDSVGLGLWLWFGFSAMMWVGAILWEKTPWQIALVHSGDWLVKTVLITTILALLRKERLEAQTN